MEQTWNRRGTRGTPREWAGTPEQVFVGVDPGLHAGGLALVLGDGSAVQLTWWRSLSRGFEFLTWNGCGLDVERHDTLARGVYLSLPRVKATSAAVEAVRRHRGRSAPLTLATAAGTLVGLLEAQGARVLRPGPSEWRSVYFGKPIALERERAKRLALDWMHGREHPGTRGEVLQPHGLELGLGTVDVPDHAAEALGLAVWAAGMAARWTVPVSAEADTEERANGRKRSIKGHEAKPTGGSVPKSRISETDDKVPSEVVAGGCNRPKVPLVPVASDCINGPGPPLSRFARAPGVLLGPVNGQQTTNEGDE